MLAVEGDASNVRSAVTHHTRDTQVVVCLLLRLAAGDLCIVRLDHVNHLLHCKAILDRPVTLLHLSVPQGTSSVDTLQ